MTSGGDKYEVDIEAGLDESGVSALEDSSNVDVQENSVVSSELELPTVVFEGFLSGKRISGTHGEVIRIDGHTLQLQFQFMYNERTWDAVIVAEEIPSNEPTLQYKMRTMLRCKDTVDYGDGRFGGVAGGMLQSSLIHPRKHVDGIDNVIDDFSCEIPLGIAQDRLELCGELSWFEEPCEAQGMLTFIIEEQLGRNRHMTPVECDLEYVEKSWEVSAFFVLLSGETYGVKFDIPTFQTHENWSSVELKLTVTHTTVSASNQLNPIYIQTLVGVNIKGDGRVLTRSQYRLMFDGYLMDDLGDKKAIKGVFVAKMHFIE